MSENTKQKIVCIGCPLGCQLDVEFVGDEGWKSTGYQCKKGKVYAVQEVTDPRRMVATTIAIKGSHWARLPVRTATEVPKEQVMEVCRALHQICVESPVEVGQVVLANVVDTGVDVIATRSM